MIVLGRLMRLMFRLNLSGWHCGTSLWKDTAEGIEFRHNTNYAVGTVATGGSINGIPVPMPISEWPPANVITAQIGVYF